MHFFDRVELICRTILRLKNRCNPFRIKRQWKLERAKELNENFIDRMPGINMRMVINPNMFFATFYAEHLYEREIIRFIKKYIKKSMIALDIGANIGYFTLLLSRMVGNQGKVICFEPSKYAYDLLKENIRINCLENVQVYQQAVSDTSGETTFFEGPEGYEVYSSLQPPVAKGSEGIHFSQQKVQVDTIDHMLGELGVSCIDFVKIDVEGAELKVIRSMKNTLKNNRQIKLLFEGSENLCAEFGYSLKELIEEVEMLGFHCQYLDKRGCLREIDWADPLWNGGNIVAQH